MPDRAQPGRGRRVSRAFALSALALALTFLGGEGAPSLGAAQLDVGPCAALTRPDGDGRFIAASDLRPVVTTDGDDLLALVDRSPEGALPADYVPRDLVDLANFRPSRAGRCVPPRRQCLREPAARAYREMARAMREAGLRPVVSSAYRSYRVQCATLLRWVARDPEGLCGAVRASALPGHSQHQLGTTLDLFTSAWSLEGDRFREGYGCSPGGRWIAENASRFGFVLPYPLHPDYRDESRPCAARPGLEAALDPRTGYRYEPWHLRYLGEHAARFERARAARPDELTLDRWLRAERGLPAASTPICDGCDCGRCSTSATETEPQPCAPPPPRRAARPGSDREG